MNTLLDRRARLNAALLTLSLGLSSAMKADTFEVVDGTRLLPPQQTIELGTEIVFIQAPPPGWNVARIQTGTRLQLKLAEVFSGATNVSWWRDEVQLAATGAETTIDLFTQENPTAPEDAMLVALRPGAYTATVRSASGATGEVMIEIYEVSAETAESLQDYPMWWIEAPVDPGD